MALKQFRRAYGIDDNFGQAYLAAGIIFEEEGKFAEALQHYQKYITIGGKRILEVKEWIKELEAQLKTGSD